jgi:hypothetical protein
MPIALIMFQSYEEFPSSGQSPWLYFRVTYCLHHHANRPDYVSELYTVSIISPIALIMFHSYVLPPSSGIPPSWWGQYAYLKRRSADKRYTALHPRRLWYSCPSSANPLSGKSVRDVSREPIHELARVFKLLQLQQPASCVLSSIMEWFKYGID